MNRRRPPVALAALTAVLTALSAGCSIPQAAPASGGSASPPAASSAVTSSATPDSGASAAGIDPARPPSPVGVVQVACAPGSGVSRVTIGVLRVERRGQVAVATFVVTGVPADASGTSAASPVAVAGASLGSLGACSGAAFDPRLVDGANLVAYSPLRSGTSEFLRSNPYQVFPGTAPTYLSAVFPAPRPGVSAVDVWVGAGSVPGVAVS